MESIGSPATMDPLIPVADEIEQRQGDCVVAQPEYNSKTFAIFAVIFNYIANSGVTMLAGVPAMILWLSYKDPVCGHDQAHCDHMETNLTGQFAFAFGAAGVATALGLVAGNMQNAKGRFKMVQNILVWVLSLVAVVMVFGSWVYGGLLLEESTHSCAAEPNPLQLDQIAKSLNCTNFESTMWNWSLTLVGIHMTLVSLLGAFLIYNYTIGKPTAGEDRRYGSSDLEANGAEENSPILGDAKKPGENTDSWFRGQPQDKTNTFRKIMISGIESMKSAAWGDWSEDPQEDARTTLAKGKPFEHPQLVPNEGAYSKE